MARNATAASQTTTEAYVFRTVTDGGSDQGGGMKAVWIRCDTGSASSLRVAIAACGHTTTDYATIAAGESQEFIARPGLEIQSIWMDGATGTATYSMRQIA